MYTHTHMQTSSPINNMAACTHNYVHSSQGHIFDLASVTVMLRRCIDMTGRDYYYSYSPCHTH